MSQRRLEQIRDRLEAQGCPTEHSSKLAESIYQCEKGSLAGAIASQLLIVSWRLVWQERLNQNEPTARN